MNQENRIEDLEERISELEKKVAAATTTEKEKFVPKTAKGLITSDEMSKDIRS